MTGCFRTERQRRERFSVNYQILKSLIPKISKPDRATIIEDTINYINQLQRTIKELRLHAEYKENKSPQLKDAAPMDEEQEVLQEFDGHKSSKNSWLQWKSMKAFVDVRIIEDEVSIKLIQSKMNNNNSLLIVSRFLENLELELLHLSGGEIGKRQVFMFNSKIYDPSTVYARAITKKLVEALSLE